MGKKIMVNGYWEDEKGNKWFPTLSTTYPDGKIDKVHLDGPKGLSTWIRFDQVGNPIAGNLSLRYVGAIA